MVKKKKRGLIDRMFMGTEKSEGYARASLPSNRWELFWDILKGRFGKLVILNLLMLVFAIPFILLLFFRSAMLSGFGAMYPFSQCFGTGYGSFSSMVGYGESIAVSVDAAVFLVSPLAFMIFAIGLSGGAYVIRNLVWTEGVFVTNDFWRGLRQNVGQMIMIALVYAIVFYLCNVSIALCNQYLALGQGATWLFTISLVVLYAFMILFSIATLHMITMSVTYKLKFRHLLKNSLLFAVAFLMRNVVFFVLALIPFILFMLGGIFQAFGIIAIVLIGLSLPMLVWTNYSQWIYDNHINEKIGAKKGRGMYTKIKSTNSTALKQYKEQLDSAQLTSLNSRPIKPITDDELKVAELPTSFNRKDLLKLKESKEAIYEDHKRYVEEHMNDPQFKPAEEDKEKLAKERERQKRIERAKKELSKRKR